MKVVQSSAETDTVNPNYYGFGRRYSLQVKVNESEENFFERNQGYYPWRNDDDLDKLSTPACKAIVVLQLERFRGRESIT